jgi:hypothetical protein
MAAHLLDMTPDPLDDDDVYTSRTDSCANFMKDLGEDLHTAVEHTGPDRAEVLARALADARRDMAMVCATLEDEYDRARRVPAPGSLLGHARRVRRLLHEEPRELVPLAR